MFFCRREMNLLQSIVIYCFLLHLLNRPLNDFPKLYPLPHPCQGAFPLRFLSAQNRRQRPPSSTSLQKLKIRWANRPCGFDPRHRHHRALAKASARSGLFRCAEEDTPGDVAEGVGSRGGKGASHPGGGCGRRPLRKHHSTKPGIHRSQTDDAHLRIVC